MCGINLVISQDRKITGKAIEQMQLATKYRGPDAAAVEVGPTNRIYFALGANRLRVIDCDHGADQPMRSSCGKFLLAYNGEVYNYQSLKNKLLALGQKFRTNSDTEVVLYWLKTYGAAGLADFKGMFALIFYNEDDDSWLLARDRYGIKPLFYFQDENTIMASSSSHAIEISSPVKLSLNPKAIDEYLAFRHTTGNTTFYSQVFSVEAGQFLTFDSDRSVKNGTIAQSNDVDVLDLKSALTESLALTLSACSKPGLMLSGGVDSTLLLALLSGELAETELNTYSLAVGDDVSWSKKASQLYKSRHHEVKITADLPDYTHRFFRQMDQPIGDSGALATWLVAAEAAKESNTLLSGAGADELFGGYNRHRAYYFYLTNKKIVLRLKKTLGNLRITQMLPSQFNQFIISLDEDNVATYRNFLQNYGIRQNSAHRLNWITSKKADENMSCALAYDFKNYLVNDVLSITDNACMQQGVEARVPYLYDTVVTSAGAISIAERMRRSGKGPLKEMLTAYGGGKFSERRKQGFGLPLKQWIASHEWTELWAFIQTDAPIFKFLPRQTVEVMLAKHQNGKADHSMQLWSILVLQSWLNRYYR